MFFSCLESIDTFQKSVGGSYLIGFYLSNSALTYGELSE